MITSRGTPEPFGATYIRDGVNFSLFYPGNSTLTLCLFDKENSAPLHSFPLDPNINKTGNTWHIHIKNLSENLYYAYRMSDNNSLNILDPYARGVSSSNQWGRIEEYNPLGMIWNNHPFDWENDKPLDIPLSDMIIYEMHVRAFTQHPSSQVKHKGTFAGLIEKIPYLVDLGINAVELLPIQEFNEMENKHINPTTKERLYQFWGYSTVSFFSLMNRYSSQAGPVSAIQEFKMMVRELHKNGIEVILDMVFNHTAEGNKFGPIFSFKGLATPVYYTLHENGEYSNYTGCGNTVNCNHPIVIEMILECLRYWVVEMHVDGFRFDLAAIFTRGSHGEVLKDPPLLAAISNDPILAKTKLIAEAWDAAGLYQVGHFYKESPSWSEWNGNYRDVIRRFIKGTPGIKGEFATRICGSQDLYHDRKPTNSINFVTCHDGFSLMDLVSFNQKHNIENGEKNHDGSNFNDSWNCGVEGLTDDKDIIFLRERQMRNFVLALLVSQGIPMLNMGDEYAHTKRGNNNTWCQDNDLNWFLWDKLEVNQGFYRFYRLMIDFRKKNKIFSRDSFLTSADIEWHGIEPGKPMWEEQNHFIAFTLVGLDQKVYVAFNAHDQEMIVELPQDSWVWVVNTSQPSPEDFLEEPKRKPVSEKKLPIPPYSSIMLIAK